MPRKSLETVAHRRILLRMMLDLHALIREANIPIDEAVVLQAVRLGQYEGRAMDVSDIAGATRLPISSVSRHVKTQRKKGRVWSVKAGRRTLQYIPLVPESQEVSRFYEEVEQIVRRACHDLSNLRTSDIDKP
jgi:DNA-binding MarR family transcriptional regulator